MKLQLKTLVAAIALIAVAGHAAAAAAPITLPATATGSDLLFYAFDDATKSSYVQDLGQTFSSFLPAAGNNNAINVNISSSAAWASYLTSVNNNTSNTYWGVISGLKANALNSGNGIETTLRVGNSIAGQTAANAKGAVATPMNGVMLGINGATTTPAAGYFSVSGGSDNIANNWGHNGAGKLVFNTDNAIGAISTFQYLNLGTSVVNTTFAQSVSFDGTSLVIAAVPEPSTYAMLLAGLMLVGGIASRRRNSAK